VPGREQLRPAVVRLLQGFTLVAKHLQGDAGIQFGVIDLATLEAAVLVMLHQVVIGIARIKPGG